MRSRNAIHESAHAVAACLLGLQVRSISAGRNGRFQLATDAKSNQAALAITYLAGAAAERVMTGMEVWLDQSDPDYDSCNDAIVGYLRGMRCSWYAICGDDVHDLVGDCYEAWMAKTTSMIHDHWPCVTAIARELTKRRTLTGEQVQQIFRREEAKSIVAQFVS